MHHSVNLVDVEIKLSKDMIFAFLKGWDFTSIVFNSGLHVTSNCTRNRSFACCKDAMHLIQVLRLCDNRNFSWEPSNPNIIALRSHKVWFQPNSRLSCTIFSSECQEFSFKVTLEVNIHDWIVIKLKKRALIAILVLMVSLFMIELRKVHQVSREYFMRFVSRMRCETYQNLIKVWLDKREESW
jgi:hypothetical protein